MTSDVTSKFPWWCRTSVLWSGKEALDVASDDPPDEALSCRHRAWDVPYIGPKRWGFFHNFYLFYGWRLGDGPPNLDFYVIVIPHKCPFERTFRNILLGIWCSDATLQPEKITYPYVARFARVDLQIRESSDSRESFQGSQTEPLFLRIALRGAKNYELQVWGNSHESREIMEIAVFLQIDSREWIHANRPDSLCESPPGNLSTYLKFALFKAQLGEPFVEIWSFFIFRSFFICFYPLTQICYLRKIILE